ncbi:MULTISPECIES: hypothetical protein [Sphingomonadaceae]|uniref:hypothetical protein n=1 Tax=Sphingomonadaceae TaxID=41297 RepID=UPI00115ACA71|nr:MULTISPECIES: hypothetical protein [Sphingomonadaceae]QDK32727.1 hypothetical protein DM450_08005 [Sphingomonas sp. IC081]QSR18462.1 hypothetical protein CA833_14915 [Novosphingobium sp. KA1]
MLFLKILAYAFGALAVACGLLWVCQGTGLLLWPANSFMLDDRGWAIRGAVMVSVGLILVWLAYRADGRSRNGL